MKKIGLLLLLAMALLVAAASVPSGWKWDKKARADEGEGWSWNAQVVSDGSAVTLAGSNSTVTLAAPAGTDPDVGDKVLVSTQNDDTLLGFKTDDGGVTWVPLGWSWND